MQTGTAHQIAFREDDIEPERGGAQRGAVPAGAATDDEDICFMHDFSLRRERS
ncbi:hypothetical protein ACH4U6_27985 [Streptomyces netropsis]|uniref:hypothetical protein n=1 Tax=Streptomyces netropsis TaxID=55404 RepID=UPI00379E7AFA